MALSFLHIQLKCERKIVMLVVKIMNEFLHGPIWTYKDGIARRNPPVIENDPIVQELNQRAGMLFDSYYEFDSNGQACWFNEEKQKETREEMLFLIASIVKRLNEINDGSYVVENLES